MKNLKFIFILLAFTQVFICFGKGTNPKDSIAKVKIKKATIVYFEGSFKQALDKAKAENKMIFIDSYTSWCGPCKQMQSLLATDEKLGTFLTENFVCISMNIEKGEGPKLKRKYPHYTFPTLLFIKNNGKLKNKFVGLPNYGALELLNFAKIASK